MANFDTIKTAIDANIKTNGTQDITGGKMNSILKQMVDATDEQLTELESQLAAKVAIFLPKGELTIDYDAMTLTIPEGSAVRVKNNGFVVGGTIPLLEEYYTSMLLVFNSATNEVSVHRYNYTLAEEEQFLGAFTIDYTNRKIVASFALPFGGYKFGAYSTRERLIYDDKTGNLVVPAGGVVILDGKSYVTTSQTIMSTYLLPNTNAFALLCFNPTTELFSIRYYDTTNNPTNEEYVVDVIRVSLDGNTPNAIWTLNNNPIRFADNFLSFNGYGETLLYELNNPLITITNSSFGVGDVRTYGLRLTLSKKLPPHYNKVTSKIKVNSNSPYRIGLQIIDVNGNVANSSSWVNPGAEWEQTHEEQNDVVIQWVTTRVDGGNISDDWETILSYMNIESNVYGSAETQFRRNLFHLKQVCRGKAGFDIIAHRGYHFTGVPENSLDSYRIAAKMGYKYVETDVHLTSDGVAVICHDDTINRTFRNMDYSSISETIYIRNISYSELATKYIQVSEIKKYRKPIPTLREFLTLCKKYGLFPILEIKENIDALTLTTYNMANQMLGDGNYGFIGFHYKQLDYARTLSKKSMVIYIGNGILDTNNTIDSQSRNNPLNAWFPWEGYTPVVTKEIIEQYHANGMKVVCYPETNNAYNQCTDWGYDFAVSNYISPNIDGKAGFVASSEFDWYDFILNNCQSNSDVESVFGNPVIIMPQGATVSVVCPNEVMIAGVFINIVAKGKFVISDGLNNATIDSGELKEYSYALMILGNKLNKNGYYPVIPNLIISSEDNGSELHSVDFNVVKYW